MYFLCIYFKAVLSSFFADAIKGLLINHAF